MKKVILFIFFFLFIKPVLAITINLPYGNTYGLNESVFINGTTTPSTQVYLYYYETTNGISSAILWSSTTSDSQGKYNFTWYNETEANFTLFVNTSSTDNASTTVNLTFPISVYDLSPSQWYYFSRGEGAYYTTFFNISVWRNITKIDFYSDGNVQAFYMQQLHGGYSNCKNVAQGENCSLVFRYDNIPSGNQTFTITFKTYYSLGNFYSSSFQKWVIVNSTFDLIKSIKLRYQNSTSYTFPLTDGGSSSCTNPDGGSVIYYIRSGSSTNAITVDIPRPYKHALIRVRASKDYRVTLSLSINGGTYSSRTSYSTCGSGKDATVTWLVIGEDSNVTNVSFYVSSVYNYDASSSIPIYVDIYVFNDTYLRSFPSTSLISGSKVTVDTFNIDIWKEYYGLYTEIHYQSWTGDAGTTATKSRTYLNGVKITEYDWYIWRMQGWLSSILDEYLSSSNTIEFEAQSGISAQYLEGYYISYLRDLIFSCSINATFPENYRGGKDITLLFTNKTYNLTCLVINNGLYTLEKGNVTLILPPKFSSNGVVEIPSLGVGEGAYVTFIINTPSDEVLRGFGLDTMILIAQTKDSGFGIFPIKFRFLPDKSADIYIDVPERVQAGGLFRIYTTFIPEEYSIFYPHVFVDLAGTMGFETGVSSAYMGNKSTIRRCFDVTIYTQQYRSQYRSCNIGSCPNANHDYWVYDKYGFLGIPKGSEEYSIGKIMVGYGVLEPGDWKMFGIYDFFVNGFAAETGTLYSDWDITLQFIYKFLDITEVPQSINIISGTDVPLPTQEFNRLEWAIVGFPTYIYESGGSFYARTYPVSNTLYWVPCLYSGSAPIGPPFNIYILYVKTGEDAFSLPAGERLAVIDNQWVEPGQFAEGVEFKALAPLKPGIYNITVFVYDDAETGLFWYNTTQIRVIPALPGAGIVVSQKDIPLETIIAKKPEENPRVLMKRIVYVTNKQGFDDYQVRWVANPLPPDATYISGVMEGSIDFLADGETANPSNITYYLPGVYVTTSSITYESRILAQGNATGKITLYVYNNASTQPYYNVIVNVTKFIPSGWSVLGDEIWTISLIQPGENISRTFYLASDLPIVTCEMINRSHETVIEFKDIKWEEVVVCKNPSTVNFNFTYPYPITSEARNIEVNGTTTELYYTDRAYIDLEGYVEAGKNVTFSVTYYTPPVIIEVSPPKYPPKFYVGENATLIVDVTVKNWCFGNISNVSKKIEIQNGFDLKVYKDGYEIDSVDFVRDYYTLEIYNLTPYELREYKLSYKVLVADSEVMPYIRKVINKTQYLIYPVKVRSLASFPLSPLYQRFEHESPFSCYDIGFVWLSNKENYLNPSEGEELEFECDNNYTLIKLKDLSGPGEEEYYTIFVVEEKPTPIAPIQEVLYNFFEFIIRAIRNFINYLISFFK